MKILPFAKNILIGTVLAISSFMAMAPPNDKNGFLILNGLVRIRLTGENRCPVLIIILHPWIPAFAGMTISRLFRVFTISLILCSHSTPYALCDFPNLSCKKMRPKIVQRRVLS